jgi:hypothetical protein
MVNMERPDPNPASLSPQERDASERLLCLGPDMTARSRVKGFKYFSRSKLCDVLIHGDHLSVYIRNLTPADDETGLAVVGLASTCTPRSAPSSRSGSCYRCSTAPMHFKEPDNLLSLCWRSRSPKELPG